MAPPDLMLRRIFEESKRIAVVGCSKDPAKEAHTVPKYLQEHGYRIFPVNPTAAEILGEKAYPSLVAIPEPFDLVLLFRPSDQVEPFVDETLQTPAKVIWMQLGIKHERAAEKATRAGKTVVMDACMRTEHRRLFGG